MAQSFVDGTVIYTVYRYINGNPAIRGWPGPGALESDFWLSGGSAVAGISLLNALTMLPIYAKRLKYQSTDDAQHWDRYYIPNTSSMLVYFAVFMMLGSSTLSRETDIFDIVVRAGIAPMLLTILKSAVDLANIKLAYRFNPNIGHDKNMLSMISGRLYHDIVKREGIFAKIKAVLLALWCPCWRSINACICCTMGRSFGK